MNNENIKTLYNAKYEDIADIFEAFKSNGLIFQCDFEQIAKHFLSNFLPINTFSVDFITLHSAYLKSINKSVIATIKNEKEFYKYICKLYFDLVREPQKELLDTFKKTIEDLKEVDDTLKEIQDKLEEITRDNKTDEIQEKKPILYYYQERNQKAKDNILNFLKNDIYDYSLNKCYDKRLFIHIFNDVPYNYSWNKQSYKLQYPNDLANKFEELPLREFQKIHKKYKENKQDFYIYLTNYIQDKNVVFSIRDILNKHHLLDVRKEIIIEAVNIFENGAKIMFANAVPTIIEGILHDLCLLNGEDEKELLQKGFQHKLDKLLNVFGYELYYEYYAFRFRLFRNKVAHGRLTKHDVDELADLLLLDLFQICKLVLSTKLKINQKRFIIDELNKNLLDPNYKYVFQYILLDKIEIPIFYNLTKDINEVEKIIESDKFWEFLEGEIDEGGEAVKHGIIKIVKLIRNRKQKEFDKRCIEILKKAAIKNIDKELADDYIKDLGMRKK
jgi:hypothetical protein